MMTMATPLSAVSTTLDWSCLSSVRALHSGGVKVAVFVVLLLYLFEDPVDISSFKYFV